MKVTCGQIFEKLADKILEQISSIKKTKDKISKSDSVVDQKNLTIVYEIQKKELKRLRSVLGTVEEKLYESIFESTNDMSTSNLHM